MLEERTKAQAVADLEYVLACLEVDWRGVLKKIQDILTLILFLLHLYLR
jgi:hypothetical protein